MINKWEAMSKKSAVLLAESWSNLPTDGFTELVERWKHHDIGDIPPEYLSLRQKLLVAYDGIKATLSENNAFPPTKTYQFEYRFALRVYEIMLNEGITNRTASDDNVWRYISMVICPDLVYDRWHDSSNPKAINSDRFYDGTRRIWLKVLWWYVYLCWQGTEEATEKLIATNNSNEISQLVERVGIGGYRVNLFREIIKYYDTKITQDVRSKEKNLLSRVLQLNIARSQVIEPELVDGGLPEYVRGLFGYFNH